MTSKDTARVQRYIEAYPSRERVQDMEWWIVEDGGSLPEDFDVDSISWVTPRIGITDFEGSLKSIEQGNITINVAGELYEFADITMPVEPHSGTVKDSLDELADFISDSLDSDSDAKVVVNCAMGIERSPLTVVWYLTQYQGLTLDEAYALVRKARPVAVERRYWIEGYEDTRKER